MKNFVMKQIFYLMALVVTMYFAFKVMAKVKDIPKEDENPEPAEELSEEPEKLEKDKVFQHTGNTE